jgi:hypothetical protein
MNNHNPPEEDNETDSISDDDGGRCPICAHPWGDGWFCEHLVSTWTYADDGGIWAGDVSPESLLEVAEQSVNNLCEAFTDKQLRVIHALLQLPPELLQAISENLEDGDYSTSAWADYIGRITVKAPTYYTSTDAESSSPGMSCDWSNSWAENPKKWAKFVDRTLSKDIRSLKKINRLTKSLIKKKPEE